MDKDSLNLLGLLFPFGAGLFFFIRRKSILKKKIHVEGEIIKLERPAEMIYAQIQFKTLTGETVVVKYEVGRRAMVKQGEKVQVYYHPDDPSSFRIDNAVEKWLPPSFMIVSLCVALYFIFFATRK